MTVFFVFYAKIRRFAETYFWLDPNPAWNAGQDLAKNQVWANSKHILQTSHDSRIRND